MGFTELGDPLVRSCLIFLSYPSVKAIYLSSQVGPVLNKFEPGGIPYGGQYIVAGFSGHGMPRALGWFVYSSLFTYSDDQISQRGYCGSHDRVRDHGPRVGATAVVPTTLSYGLSKALPAITSCRWHGGSTQSCTADSNLWNHTICIFY